MAKKKKKRGPSGSGSIRKRKDGTWEGRYTYTDEYGVRKRASVYASTQAECQKKLNAALAAADKHEQIEKPSQITLADWFSIWLKDYCRNVRPETREEYRRKAEKHIISVLGNAILSNITPMQVQRWINRLADGHEDQKPLAPKTVKNLHGLLHVCLKQAVKVGLIKANPADNANLPRVEKPDLHPLMDDQISDFLVAIHGHRFENLFLIALFTGLRQSELLGLQWRDIDLDRAQLIVRRQLQKEKGKGEDNRYIFVDPKNGKERIVPLPPSVVKAFRDQQRLQAEWQLQAGPAWDNNHDLVFTDEIGHNLSHRTVYNNFKKVVASIGCPMTRFHDLRHSCAILQLQAGVPVKAVQEQLGHHSSAFTMDVYGAVSGAMMDDSRTKLEQIIQDAQYNAG